jgi:ADP-ribosylglycohydrolase
VAVNLAARELLHGNHYFIDEVVHRVKDGAPRVLLDAIRRAPWEEQGELPITRDGESGYVVYTVEIAFWFATHGRALEDALVFLAQAGGDTDTNAAVAGALLGARDGEAAIPPRWMDQLRGREDVLRVTERLLEREAS